jgi:hypothetical protein
MEMAHGSRTNLRLDRVGRYSRFTPFYRRTFGYTDYFVGLLGTTVKKLVDIDDRV